jgi:prepilin-type N-terminal cleavage/methylation domain-containing protein/prepilin-type processing-associated H-X9-DG protein
MIRTNSQLRRCNVQIGDLPRSSRAGFTLIEVLVVVAIIALLISILLPSLAAARRQARAVVCGNDVKQMGMGMATFATEQKNRVPRGISRHGSPDASGPVNWVRMIARMLGDRNNYAENFNRVPVERHAIFSCPERSQQYGGNFLDYVINSVDTRGPMTLTGCKQNPSTGSWYEVEGVTKLDLWEFPADTVYVTEAVEESWGIVDANNTWGTLQGVRENIASVRQDVPPSQTGFDWFDVPGGNAMPTHKKFTPAGTGSRLPRASIAMHGNGSNAVFVDGHVEVIKPPKESVGELNVYQFYMRRFGVDRKIIKQVRATNTTAQIDPCTQGDTKWRPGK